MNVWSLIPLVGFGANLLLAGLAIARNPKGKASRLAALFALAIAYWALVKFSWRLTDDTTAALVLYKASAFGWCMLPSIFLHFGARFVGAPGWVVRVGKAGHLVGLAFALLTLWPDLMVQGMTSTRVGLVFDPGPLYRVFRGYLDVVFLATIGLLVVARVQNWPAVRRSHIDFVLVGASLSLLLGTLMGWVLPRFGYPELEMAEGLSTINAAVMTYAMIRHGLFAVSPEDAAETIITTMGDSLIVFDRNGLIAVTNPATSRLLGVEKAELLGAPVTRFVHSRFLAEGPRALKADEVREEEGHYLPPEGEPIPVILSASAVISAGDAPTGVVLVAKDIREIRRTMRELAEANEKLEHQAITDALTGVANRRYADQRLLEEFLRCRRTGRSFSVGLLDLDDFKRVNDRFGHPAGDEVLRAVAGLLRANVRSNDLVARWGGDEFLLLLPETDAEAARVIGNRMVDEVCALRLPGIDGSVGASLGMCTLDRESLIHEAGDVVRWADEYLYDAKRNGKGRLAAG